MAVAIAYLLGSIPFSYLVVRLVRGIDVRSVGSGNAGATNVLRAAGKSSALLALVLDVAKGIAAVLLARRLGLGAGGVGVAGVAAVVGHVFPVFLGFRGGKGVATAGGVLGSIAPWPALGAGALWVLVVAWKRYVSLGSVIAISACPLLIAAFGAFSFDAMRRSYGAGWPGTAAAASAIAVLVVFKHRANLSRLIAGTEARLGARSGPEARKLGEGGRG